VSISFTFNGGFRPNLSALFHLSCMAPGNHQKNNIMGTTCNKAVICSDAQVLYCHNTIHACHSCGSVQHVGHRSTTAVVCRVPCQGRLILWTLTHLGATR
jgi:hypothetical protein